MLLGFLRLSRVLRSNYSKGLMEYDGLCFVGNLEFAPTDFQSRRLRGFSPDLVPFMTVTALSIIFFPLITFICPCYFETVLFNFANCSLQSILSR